ncbi:MAG TPA: glycerol-3-phosphate 1-O-acyltransferase PlsB [Steroidobacteraceae bacterium]|nr:glycerol-3-phosphate 1-O-acyltransferase PlsB [Steroidobacteraceae bacterium]
MLARLQSWLVRGVLRPEEAAARLAERGAPVCYVLQNSSETDLALLQQVCLRERLPRPLKRLPPPHQRERRSYFSLSQPVGLWRKRLDRRTPELLLHLIDALRKDGSLDIQLVPAAVYWGRAPQKEKSWIRLFLSEDWTLGSRLRRFFTVLVNGRNTTLQLGESQSLRALIDPEADTALNARRIARQLRSQLARMRTANIGPDLSHRRTIVNEVLRTQAVRAAVRAEVRDRKRKLTRRQSLLGARKLAMEIAANYSPSFVSFMSGLLTWLWDKLYDGVEFRHIQTLQQVAEGNEIIYVPCHRSHMDYLLLGYAIYQRGYAVPHTAAGINLNLPVVGRFLRMGGAFFIRRSLRGSGLYTVVFSQYLGAMMARGHSIEYFIEGGRSRTGRLLTPMTGMLSMSVRSYLREPRRPVVFVPVYFGYERVFEGPTYLGELSGKPKEKETVGGLLRAFGKFRERFGRVHVNLGEPVHLNALLDQHARGWRGEPFTEAARPQWFNPLVDDLAQRVMRNINSAAAVTPVNLLALALLSTPRQAVEEGDLLLQLQTLMAVLRAVPYSQRVTYTELAPAAIIDYGVALKLITREQHKAGNFVRMSPENAVLATYYRNNVLHLFALPSLLACCFLSNPSMSTEDLQRLGSRIYPYVAAELFLRWDETQLPQILDQLLTAMAGLGLLETVPGATPALTQWRRPAPISAQATQLSLLAQSTLQTVERYYLAIALLIRAGSGQITQKALEERSQLMAQRMTLLYGFNSPEFFDRTLFENFIDLLRSRKVVQTDAAGCLLFDDILMRVASDAQLVLSEQIRHSILQVTHG